MLTIGLTGGIGSGKTVVATIFKELGAPIIDTDEVAREVVLPGKPGYATALAHFGAQILDASGSINRKVLREIVFKDPQERMWLEQILHPLIIHETLQQIEQLRQSRHTYCIVVIPLLAENLRVKKYLDRVLVIDCSENTQIMRTMTRDHISEAAALIILKTQATRQERLAIADDVVNNEEIDIAALRKQVKELHDKYSKPTTA